MNQLAIIADTHGNSWALSAVLNDIDRREIPDIVNLGDSADDVLDPAGVVSLLMDRNVPSIAGNYETHKEGQLSDDQIAWLESLPKFLEIGDIFCCHGTPSSDHDELIEDTTLPHTGIASDEIILSRLDGNKHSVILCAHKHVPRCVMLSTGQLVINPGSVGWPAYWNDKPNTHIMEAGSPHARYAILSKSDAGYLVDHVAVPYDWQTPSAIAAKGGFGERAVAIKTGRMKIPPDEFSR